MKLLLDMNISPDWCELFAAQGFECVHWNAVGSPDAPDRELLRWARESGYIVFTHDLDFGAILANTGSESPSVIQIRIQDIHPRTAGTLVIENIRRFSRELETGALISIDRERSRARILPIS
jgi:predicted nuclease of predicted toxin-antitoxin system